MDISTNYASHALNHSSGQVVYDFTGDGLTDLLLFPTLFNQGAELPGKAFSVVNGNVADFTTVTLPTFTTGFVKDWFVANLGGGNRPDLLLIDHGLELPETAGGFQYGFNRLLIAGDGTSLALDSSVAQMPKNFYHAGATGDYLGIGKTQMLFQQFADSSQSKPILLLQQETSGAYKAQSVTAFEGYAYNPGAVATVHVSGLGHDLLALGSYVTPDKETGKKSISLWDFKVGTPTKVASWDYPSAFGSPSQGAFKIIAGDFRNAGNDDLIVLLESVDLSANYKRSWVYLSYDPKNGFTDTTTQVLGGYDAPRSIDEIKVGDVNNDGHPDLIGFSFDNTVFANNNQILLNNGEGHFTWMNTKAISSEQAVFIPQMLQDSAGNFSDLKGFYKLTLTGAQSAAVNYQSIGETIGTGPGYVNAASYGAPGFNESYYLSKYNEAAAAVASGAYSSGLDHYLKVGRGLNYQAFAPGTKINGTSRIDTVCYNEASDSYVLALTANGASVMTKGFSTPDILQGVERIKFSDKSVALDISGNAGQAYRLYQAAFNRTPDKGGLGYQMNALDTDLSLTQVAQNFINSPEFSKTYGSLDDTQFVTQLYQNVLHRAPDSGGLSFHVNNLSHGVSRAQTLVGFSESPENQAALIGVIQSGMEYMPVA